MDVITFAGVPRDYRHAYRVSNEWITPAKLVRRATSAPQTHLWCATTCQLTRCSHAGQRKSFVRVQNIFGGLVRENVSWRVRTFPKRVQRSQNVWESCVYRVGRVTMCGKILPHAGHTLTPHVYRDCGIRLRKRFWTCTKLFSPVSVWVTCERTRCSTSEVRS